MDSGYRSWSFSSKQASAFYAAYIGVLGVLLPFLGPCFHLPAGSRGGPGHALTFAAAHLVGIQLVQRATPPASRRRARALYPGLTFGLGIVVGFALPGPCSGGSEAAAPSR